MQLMFLSLMMLQRLPRAFKQQNTLHLYIRLHRGETTVRLHIIAH